MMNQIYEFILRSVTWFFLGVYFGGSYYFSKYLFYGALALSCSYMLFVEWPRLVGRSYRWVTPLFPGLSLLSLFYLVHRFYETDWLLPTLPLVLAWTADTCAYLVGKVYGNHKICPSISPGKSWEGLAGGFAGVLMVSKFLLPSVHVSGLHFIAFEWSTLILFSALMTFMAFSGGMLMSWLKRKKGVKDTASLLPGHGGFLDRFDSVLFVAPTLLLIVLLAK